MTARRQSGGIFGVARILCGLTLTVLTPGAAVAATSVVAGIPVGGAFTAHGVGANPSTNKIYVAVAFRGLQVIDGASNTELYLRLPGSLLRGVAVNPNLNRIYAAEYGNGTGTQIHVIDGTNDTFLSSVTVGTGPYWIGVNPITDFKYVGNTGPEPQVPNDGSVSVIDNTNTVIATVTLTGSGDPAGIAVHTGTGRVYVANQGANTIDVINPATNMVDASIMGMDGPIDVVVDSVANLAYVANYNNDTLTVINTITDMVVLGSPILVGDGPHGVALNPARNRAYVSSNNNGSRVSVVNVLTRGTEETVSFLIGLGPQDAEYNSANDSIYVTTSGDGETDVLRDEGEVCSGAAGSWWDTRWRRRRPIEINNGNIGETFTDFPLLVKLDTSRIDYTKTHLLGHDLRFVAADDVTVLDYEIESWNSGGTSYIWVRVPTIFGIAVTSIYMYFDNPLIMTSFENPPAVWDSDFKLVHHLNETMAMGPHLDSTSNANNSNVVDVSPQGSASGQINGADGFILGTCPGAGPCHNVDVPTAGTLNVAPAESFTVEAWIRTGPTGGTPEHIAAKEVSPGSGWDLLVWSGDQLRMGVTDTAAVPPDAIAQGGFVADNAWHYVVGRWTRSNQTAEVFVDGTMTGMGTNPSLAGSSFSNARPFRIGERGDNDVGEFNFNGTIDEVRFSKGAVPRSNDWIQAQWRSMRDQYVSFGPEAGICNLRSIGNRVYGSGEVLPQDGAGTTITAAIGSRTVDGNLTAWITANRGRGDRIAFGAFTGTILSVNSETQLTLTSPSTVGGAGLLYTISRKFPSLSTWEACIDGSGSCAPDPAVSNSLVADNRGEIGIAYKDGVLAGNLVIDGTIGNNTDAVHTITLTADLGNRHFGVADGGVIVDLFFGSPGIRVLDDYVTLEWLEIRDNAAFGMGTGGIHIGTPNANHKLVVRNNLIHNLPGGAGIDFLDARNTDIFNNIIYDVQVGIDLRGFSSPARIFNNTIFDANGGGPSGIQDCNTTNVTMRNNIVHSNNGGDIGGSARNAASSHNLTFDTSGILNSPAGGGINSAPLIGAMGVNFLSTTAPSEDLHIQPGGVSRGENTGANLSGFFGRDVDNVVRLSPWEIGADDVSQTTAVEMLSFTTAGRDRAVELAWTTASELRNLGFHLHRATAAGGPWTRITTSIIPGQGSSPTGASYTWRDVGLTNGTTYFYLLEDVETTGVTEKHGPVSATPDAAGGGDPGGEPTGPGVAYGDPRSSSLRVLERTDHGVLLELRTGGFYAVPEGDGTVRIEVPGFEESQETGLPRKRGVVEAVAGKKARLLSVEASEESSYAGLLLAPPRQPEMAVGEGGELQTSRGRRLPTRSARGPAAWLAETVFQGDVKKAEVLFAPLRRDSGLLVLSGRILARLEFSGTENDEVSQGGGRGRRVPRKPRRAGTGVIAQLEVGEPGLYRLEYDELFPPAGPGLRRREIPASRLRLSRQGEPVAYHLEPDGPGFRSGSSLYFVSEGSSLNPEGATVYELEDSGSGLRMPVLATALGGGALEEYEATATWEENHYYQAGLLEAEDLWLWDIVISPAVMVRPFSLTEMRASSSSPARLTVWLQGASDFEAAPDHHLRFRVNGIPVGETTFDGRVPKKVEMEVSPGVLREGSNQLEIENAADTGAAYSMVFLNRFSLRYPRRLPAAGGQLEGRFESAGQAEVAGLSSPAAAVVDTTVANVPRWVRGSVATAQGLAFGAEAKHRYLVTGSPHRATVRRVSRTTLRSGQNRADYLVIGPRAFLDVAEPLLDHRRSQGLVVRAVSTEEVFQEFGHGEPRAEAIKEFLEYAYHRWQAPPVRYVLLLGDATYDPKDYLATGVKNPIPAVTIRTSYLWTASDPAYAAVNGNDLTPDLAVGRLSAGSVDEAQRLVQKVLAFESGGGNFDGPAVLVADNPDLAGNFEQDADELAATVLASRNPQKIYYSRLGGATRARIIDAFDQGASLMSYVGHGGTVVWASENIFNYQDIATLSPQPQQPLLMTMNCLNGFFHFPPLDSLSEAFLKAEGKGAVAAFSPSGLSLNDPAHVFHRALLAEIMSGRHERLGDAVLAAQAAYVDSGAFPELLSIYNLLGDPAMRLR